MKSYVQAYLRGLKIISRSEQGPRLGCTGVLFAILFLFMGIVFSFYTGNRIHIQCDRISSGRVDCQIQTRWYGLLPLNELQVQAVDSAFLDEHCEDNDCAYRVVLVTHNAEIPLTAFYSAQKGPKLAAAERIQSFLDNPETVSFALDLGTVAEVGIANALPPILLGLGLGFAYFSLRSTRRPESDQLE